MPSLNPAAAVWRPQPAAGLTDSTFRQVSLHRFALVAATNRHVHYNGTSTV